MIAGADVTTARWWRYAGVAAFAVLPAVLLFGVTAIVLHTTPAHFVPTVWNDQVGAFIRVSAFRKVGLNTGYYLPDEIMAPLASSRLGVEGPFFTIFYGALASLVPWGSPSSALYLNAALVGIALAVFVTAVRLDWRQMLLLALVIVTGWPILLYMATSSEEPLNIAFAILIATGFARVLRRGGRDRVATGALGVLLVLAALERFSWAILFIPYALVVLRGRSQRAKVAGVVVSVIAIAALLRLQDTLIPPVSNAILDSLRNFSHAPIATVRTIVQAAWRYLRYFVEPANVGPLGTLDVTAGDGWSRAATLAQSYLIIGLAAISLTVCVRVFRSERRVEPLSAFNAYNLVVITVASLLVYLPLGYYRLLAGHLLLTTLLLIAGKRYRLVCALVVVNLVVVAGFVDMYRDWRNNFAMPKNTVAAERASVGQSLTYQSRAANPWCNTIFVPLDAYDQRMLAIPYGIGVSYALAGPAIPVKSRWVLTDSASAADGFSRLVHVSDMRKVAMTAIGTLYENPRSRCFDRGG
jgi:hypothetical protein